MDQDKLYALIRQAADKKAQITALEAELKDLNLQIYEETPFQDGVKTAHWDTGDVKVTVSKKEIIEWDQSLLNKARAIMGDEKFMNIFIYKWQPKNKKSLDGFLGFAPDNETKPILEAMTIKKSYSVAYKAGDNV